MSFSGGTTATSQTLVFAPSRVDVLWDGESIGKVAVLPRFTTGTVTYSVNVLHVFPSATTKMLYVGGTSATYSLSAGSPFRNNETSTYITAAPFTIANTASTASGIVSFDLMPSNTNYTAAFDAVSFATSQPSYYRWSLVQTRGTAVQTVATGRISRLPPNPYGSENAVGDLVQSQTASYYTT